MSRWLKVLSRVLALAALSIFAASCGSSSPAQVRFVNAIQDTVQYGTALDIEVNGTKDFTNVAFFGFLPSSGYTSVPAGNDTIEGLKTGTATEVFSSNVSLKPGLQYTLVATGFATSVSKVAVIPAADNNAAPVNGDVKFRVINASPSGPDGNGDAVDIYMVPVGSNAGLTSTTLIASNLAYRSTSSYAALAYNSNIVDGVNYTMFVTTTGSTIPIFSQTLIAGSSSAGAIRTLVLTDEQNVDQMNQLAIVLNDAN